MNKILSLIIMSFVVVLLDLGLVIPNFGHLYLSALVPVVFLVTVYYDLELALIFAFTTGFLFDLALLDRSLFMTFFLCFEVLIIELIRKKIVDFVNPITFVVTIFTLEIIRVIFSIIFFPNGVSSFNVFVIIAANLAFALLFTLMWWTFSFRKVRRI